MHKPDYISGIKALSYLKIMEFKNHLTLAFTHPLGVVQVIMKFIMSVSAIMWIPFALHRQEVKERLLSFHLPLNMAGAVVMLLLMAICFISLKKAVENYYPTQYTPADVNWLFTSPVSSRLIYAWSIAKQVLMGLSGSLFMAAPLVLMLRTSKITARTGGFVYAFSGIVIFIIIVQTLKFFLYSVSKRLNLASLVKTLVYTGLGTAAVYLFISVYGSTDILHRLIEVIGGKTFAGIPVIGWTKILILSPIENSAPVASLLKLIIYTSIMIFITIYLATDYYEEATVSTERISRIKAAHTKNNLEEIHRIIAKKEPEVKTVGFNLNFREAYAFLWKAMVIHKRKSKGIAAEIVKYLSFAVAGGVFAYVFRNHTYQDMLKIILILSVVFKNANTSSLEGFVYELKKNYIFLLPGRARDKILAVSILPLMKLLVRNLVLIAPVAWFVKVNALQLFSFWVVASMANLLSIFTVIVIQEVVPGGDNILLVFIRNMIEILLGLPAVGVGAAAYLLFKNIEIAVFVFGISGMLTVFGLANLCGELFNRLELNH